MFQSSSFHFLFNSKRHLPSSSNQLSLSSPYPSILSAILALLPSLNSLLVSARLNSAKIAKFSEVMAEEEAKKVAPKASSEAVDVPTPEPPVDSPKDMAEEKAVIAPPAEEKPVVAPPVEEKPVVAPPPEEKPVLAPPAEEKPDDCKALAIVEKPEVTEEKKPEGSINRDAVLARVATEKRISLIKAWEESEKSKAENKAQKKISSIAAWENCKKANLEAELKKIEEKLEKKKAEYIEKTKNKVALVHKAAEEKRAMVEAKRGEDLLKAEEIAAKYRATGTAPKKLLGIF